ncbi:MAG TPA: hypothetical protein VK745_09680 [Polyangiaceae bacterium]|jgi:hypothetical protein|nr:hypothetical protein [Polyangiaceae bacterium]
MKLAAVLGCALLAAQLCACGNSVSDLSGADEPLRVSNGQFFEGSFPSDRGGPMIGLIGSKNNTVQAGLVGKNLSGTVQGSPGSVALAFQGLGHGYWVVPVGGIDPASQGYTWSAVTDFSRSLPAGAQTLNFAAGDPSGKFGATSQLDLQVLSFIPTGHVVASLTWGNNADLDLHVVGPGGKELDPKHPNTTGLIDAGPDAGDALPGDGVLDRDSNADCVLDGWRAEDVVWTDQIEPGTYLFRVDMFSACGVPAASFKFTLYVDGQSVFEQIGRLLDVDADGGGPGSGLYIGSYTF